MTRAGFSAVRYRERIPFIYFGVEDHTDYHCPTDDFANIQPEFCVRSVETIIEAFKALDSSKHGRAKRYAYSY